MPETKYFQYGELGRFFLGSVALCVIVATILFAPSTSVKAQTGTRSWHVSGAALPLSVTSPTPIEGTALTQSVGVTMLVISNGTASTQTVTVEDCASPPFILFNGYAIAANNTWTVPMFDTRFQGCFRWFASSTTVQGTATGTR
jgi:hypothetical protein